MIFRNEADATHRRLFFVFVDNNGAPLAGQTFATASGEVFTSLDGAAEVAAAADAVAIAGGAYYYPASQAEVNGSKFISVRIHKATYTDAFTFDDIVVPLATSDQVSSIAVTSAAQNQTAASRTIASGTGSGGVVNTTALDAVFDTVSDTAGALDFYYQFDISGTADAVGVSAQWEGYLVGILNTLKVYAWNWGGSSWDQIGTVTGIAGVVVGLQEWDLTSAHTSAGLARIRFANTGLTTASLKTDRILLGYVVPAAGTTAVTAIKAKTDLLPAVAAGANTGLPIIGSQIPNANANAVGGLAIISAIGQGPGGVMKPNSMEDNCVYSSGRLTSSRLRVFATSGALGLAVSGHANGADSEVERYVSAATYAGDGTMTSFTWTKQL